METKTISVQCFGLLMATLLVCPYLVCGQFQNTPLQSMSYRIVNGKVFMDPPTTPEPSFMETWFPWLSSSYTSDNPDEVDEAIINSVTGPPISDSSSYGQNSGSSVISLPGFSQYQQQQQQQQSDYGMQNQSPYLSNDEDNYIPSASINVPQYVKPDGSYPNMNYIPNSNPSYSYAQPSYAQPPYAQPSYAQPMPPLPYPFSQLPGQTTTERSAPFYQPILDFFGFGSSDEEQLPLPPMPFNNGQFSALPNSNFISSTYTFPPPQPFAQARKSEVLDEEFKDEVVKSDSGFSSKDSQVKDEKYPCPKLGYWQWNGEVCIAVGPVPIWACKPNDLVMTGRVGVCRNKIFFSPGTNPLKNL